MPRPPLPFRMLFAVTVALWVPTALALAVLVAAEALSAGAAALAGIAVAVALALVVRPYLCDILAVRGYVEELWHRDEPRPPSLIFRSVPADVYSAVARLHRSWKKARKTLESAAAANETVLDRLPDPLLLLDARRRVVRGNRAARELLGMEISGRDLSAVLRNPDILTAADAVLGGTASEAETEFSLPVPVARDFLAGIIALPAPTADGTVALLRLHDLTAIKRTEQMRSDFVANVSHELKTPLTALIGYIETLRGAARGDPETEARFLTIMESQAARMNSLVQDLLSLSRIELHEHNAPTGEVRLDQILKATASLLEVKANRRGQTIVIDLTEEVPEVVGDANEIAQVFENLMDNAIKYGAEKGTVHISAHAGPAGTIAVAVHNDGPGIPREHLSRLTERFYRIDPARSRELGGTGLGLAIVKHIVNRHRGELRIESVEGEGSTFTVTLRTAT